MHILTEGLLKKASTLDMMTLTKAFDAKTIESATSFKIFGSDFNEAGDDYNEIQLLDKNKTLINRIRINGY